MDTFLYCDAIVGMRPVRLLRYYRKVLDLPPPGLANSSNVYRSEIGHVISNLSIDYVFPP